MDILTEHLTPEPPKGVVAPKAQPIGVLSDVETPLDDNAVRQAFMAAAANNEDPMSTTFADLDKVIQAQQAPAKAETPSQPAVPVGIPEKFLKPDGAVDVEKLQASTRQLDEASQKKEEKLQEVAKSVEDLFNHYKEAERKFRNMPNPDKMAAQIPAAPAAMPLSPQGMSDQQLRELIARDWQQDPIATTAQLIEIAIQKKMQPLEEREKDTYVRDNIRHLAEKDPRVLQHFESVTRKLEADPDLWKLKNPHKAAWLEVKEELRLGEPSQAQAQPSKPLSPVLGGGTPPSAPSSSATPQSQDVMANLDKVDLRDRRQEAMADEAIKAFLARNR